MAPILVPEEPYELEGDMPNVVFPEGAVVLGEELFIFYGGADRVCCAASIPLREFLRQLLAGVRPLRRPLATPAEGRCRKEALF